MNRLQLELHRLYVPHGPAGPGEEGGDDALIDAEGRVRAMVLALSGPADWHAVSKVWNGVQGDLDLPAPAIAVSGADGYQLWFSLLEPLAAPLATAFLEALQVRYLGDVKAERIGLMPSPDASLPPRIRHAGLVPAPQDVGGRWSAFVAPDLAPMFAEEPWLDMPPNDDGQSRLLSRLKSIPPADFQHALALLRPASTLPLPEPAPATLPADNPGDSPPDSNPARPAAGLDPKAFLIGVMNDDTVALALRIDAAKALLLSDAGSGRQ